MSQERTAPSRSMLLAAFAAVYVIWGSTYLAIRFAIETIPPFLMAGVRFLLAGAVLYAWARARGAARPGPAHWRTAFIVGGFLLVGGNGGVVWAQQTVASGVAALVVATVPLWITVFEWGLRGSRPSVPVVGGVALGFVGIIVLIGPSAIIGGGTVPLPGAAALVLAALLWSAGSLYSRSAPQPRSQSLSAAMSMLAGGLLLLFVGGLVGELDRIDPGAISPKSAMAFAYLVVLGALVGYSAYLWLMRNTRPERAATYAYVNPVVAVFLGWLLASEPLTARTLVAAAIIIGSVALIVSAKTRPPKQTTARPPLPAPLAAPARTRRSRVNRLR